MIEVRGYEAVSAALAQCAQRMKKRDRIGTTRERHQNQRIARDTDALQALGDASQEAFFSVGTRHSLILVAARRESEVENPPSES